MPDSQSGCTTIAAGRHLRLLTTDSWEFAQRVTPSGVVCVVAVTKENWLLLVEQFRPPVNRNVIELPAGLAGDLHDDPDETLESAARRELLEETGYEAGNWTRLCDVASSAGLTDEIVTIFRADAVRRVGEGGGVDGEEIIVHEIAVNGLLDWLSAADRGTRLVDSRVYAALAFIDSAERRRSRGDDE